MRILNGNKKAIIKKIIEGLKKEPMYKMKSYKWAYREDIKDLPKKTVEDLYEIYDYILLK